MERLAILERNQVMNQIRSAIIAGVIALGSAAVAGAQSAPAAPQARAQRVGEAHARGAKGARGARGARAGRMQRQLFRGIKMTDAEKTSLKAVRQKYAEQNKALREQLKPQFEAARAARQKGDTAALKALRDKNAGARDQMKKLFEAERHDLRAALTPEHQAQFDTNAQKLEQRVAKRAEKAKARRK
jgi:Spy/CpxP family protein refolding chaperone